MYSASADFLTKIKSNTRKITWSGTITTQGDSVYSLDLENIVSGAITRSISSQNLNIGTAYASTISMEMILPGVSRYELYNGTIELVCQVEGASDEIPMGIFTISEAMQAADHITIKGYDDMIKFDDVPFSSSIHDAALTPFHWLTIMCEECGVTLGSSAAQIGLKPNGRRRTAFADCVTDVKTWRDVLGYLAAFLGSFAYIGRDGALYLGSYRENSSDIVPSNFRYSSKLSDYRTTYDGLYAVYKLEGVQEYVSNSNTGGIVLDLGTNPFLQYSDPLNRHDAIQEIIDAWDGIYYVPYQSEMPLVPTYDPGDVLTFVDNQAGAFDLGAITEITYKIGGEMSVTCCGDNPRLADAQDRFTKTIAGLASEYNNGAEVGGKNFWLLHTENTEPITADHNKTQVAVIEWNQTVDVQRMGFMFTCDGELSATAVVKVLITVDDAVQYSFEVTESKSMYGKRTYNATCGYRVTGKGIHTAKVYMTVTDNSLKWSDLV